MAQLSGVTLSVSATTRSMRAGEVEGRDYFFLTRQEFESRARSRMYLEWAEYAGNLYGTPAQAVEASLYNGVDVILEIELQGADQVLSMRPDALMIYIMPPSLEELERRLRGRKTESEDAIRSRLTRAREEVDIVNEKERKGLPRMHYVIVNDSAKRASNVLAGIIKQTREDDEQADCR
jgi:guanylate kinase